MTDTATRFDILGIGNAIVDVLSQEQDAFIAEHGLTRGGMILIDGDATARAIYEAMGPTVQISGGSAANTIAGIAALGGRAGFIGKVAEDQLGEVFGHDLRALGVAFDTKPLTDGPPTGRCLVAITPDAQRSMATFIGAAAQLVPEDIDAERVAAAGITYLEGYLFDPAPAKAAFDKAARIAHAHGRKVALTLSDRFCVDRHRADFMQLIAGHIDILFANENELLGLFETEDFDQALDALRGHCAIAVVTRSEKGSVILGDERVWTVPAEPVAEVIDTTGAGDLYAAGFLWGLSRGMALPDCGRAGAIAASEVIVHIGARPEADLPVLMRDKLGAKAA